VQRPHPPILVGGESGPAYRRVARHGQGWYGFALTPERLREALAALERTLEAEGRRRDDVLVYASPKGRPDADTLRAFRDAGVDQVIVPTLARDAEGYARRMDGLAELGRQAA
jgi:alkanesulfonate monooxygenase SsuD/methylene tetrahydromethanopterin reductase-like flavin-dependent oxidoreductase (luciferase family)